MVIEVRLARLQHFGVLRLNFKLCTTPIAKGKIKIKIKIRIGFPYSKASIWLIPGDNH